MTDMVDSRIQREETREVLSSVREFLGGPYPEGDDWSFEFGEHLESNWGAVHGGALAAGMLTTARCVAPERSPRSLHIQIVRSVPRGQAFATATMRHAGRTVGTVEVNLYDERRKLAAIALLTMVTPAAVASSYHDTAVTNPFRLIASPVDPVFDSVTAPIAESLHMRARRDGKPVALHADNVRPSVDGSMAGVLECTVPWDNLELTGPECSCLIADASIGLPVMGSAMIPMEAAGPNADLTLRFTTAPASRVLLAAASMVSVQHGTATVAIEVLAEDHQLAHGLATSLLPAR
jgi:acyl-coenzyme A thioesterase PaaI-like protein